MSQEQHDVPMDGVQDSGDTATNNTATNNTIEPMDFSSASDAQSHPGQDGNSFNGVFPHAQGSSAGGAAGQNHSSLTIDQHSWEFINMPQFGQPGGSKQIPPDQQTPQFGQSGVSQQIPPDKQTPQFGQSGVSQQILPAAQICQTGDGQPYLHLQQPIQSYQSGDGQPITTQPSPTQDKVTSKTFQSYEGSSEGPNYKPPSHDMQTPDITIKPPNYIDLKILETSLPDEQTTQTGDIQNPPDILKTQTNRSGLDQASSSSYSRDQKTTDSDSRQASSSSMSHNQKTTASVSQDLLTSSVKNKDSRPTMNDVKNQNNPAAKTKYKEDISTVGDGSQTTTPPDTGTFIIKVEWKEPFPDKWEKKLQKALQSWLSPLDTNVNTLTFLENQSHALVEITPPTDVFKNGNSITLKFKPENKAVAAHIYPDTTNFRSQSTSILDKNEASSSEVTSEAEDADNSVLNGTTPFNLPLYQYWYMHNAYRRDIELIEKNHGVFIKAQVSVSIHSSKSSSSLSKASDDFQKLVQESFDSFSDATISHNEMDSEIVKGILQTIQSEKERMMFTKSASNCLIFGPKRYTNMITSAAGPSRSEYKFSESSSSMDIDDSDSPQSKPTMGMKVLDLPAQLEVDKVYWDLMKCSYEEELLQLEAKYGVSFQEDRLHKKVHAQSRGVQHLNLERHAIRALTRLYQKLVSAAVTCELRNPSDETDVVAILDKLQQSYCVIKTNGIKSWRLAGLPEHLGPAITEIEKALKKKVFDEKMKKSIGYLEDIPHARGIKFNQIQDYGAGAVGGEGWDKGVIFGAGETDSKGSSGQDSKDAPAEEETCVICMDSFTDKEKLKCGHEFCRDCLKQSVDSMGSICPICKEVFGILEGNQPEGTMRVQKSSMKLPGYQYCGSIEIHYDIPSGTQTDKHPNPGRPYFGTTRRAYLPDNQEGNEVLALLHRAFQQKLIFTVGTSTTTGIENAVTWNDIHHKTNINGGPQGYGYPDQDYLKRVKDELKAKGIE